MLGDASVTFLGHSENGDGQGLPELLRDHIRAVTNRAEQFGAAFGAGHQARIAGVLHDLGKYADQFQQRVRGIGAGRDHASAGAIVAANLYRKYGVIPAMAIVAHHIGLGSFKPTDKDWRSFTSEFMSEASKDRFTSTDLRQLQERFAADGIHLPLPLKAGLVPVDHDSAAADMLDVRMLFSCLVDADFLETEAHFDGDANVPRRPRPDGPPLDVDRAIAALDAHIGRFKPPTNDLQRARHTLLHACVDAAAMETGLFTLTAPTGTGKTLAMLAFALHHARRHSLRRIVLVMPFLNIIEQTAGIYREIFSEANGFAPNTVLEHHSLARTPQPATNDLEPEHNRPTKKPLQQLLAENWDAPIILTTSVQCLESMMSNRTSSCRKLHRLAGSVILFDEVQTIPPKLAKATLATLSRLADSAGPYRATVLFATATQPAFDVLHSQVLPLNVRGWQPREINATAPDMFRIAGRRIRTRWRHQTPISIEALATELATHDQVLCIVNLKRHASAVTEALQRRCADDSVLHLSTNMCPAHRLVVLSKVRDRLNRGEPVRLISTQCVEAGVDIDFPAVYRALAPVDSLCQAAGRCNRHGDRAEPGAFTVFQFEEDGKAQFPPGYAQAINATNAWLTSLAGTCDLDTTDLLNDPDRLRAYFRTLYGSTGRQGSIIADETPIVDAFKAGRFDEVADEYKLIDSNTITVLVPYDRAQFEALRDESERGFDDADARKRWRERASKHAVSVYRNDNSPIWPHLAAVEFYRGVETTNAEADWFVALEGLAYDRIAGLVVPDRSDLIY